MALAMVVGGCASEPEGKRELVAYTQPVREEEAVWMRGELIALTDSAAGQVTVAATEIAGTTQNAHSRQIALMWRLRVVPAFHALGQNPDPRQGLVAAWVLAAKQRMYFEKRIAQVPGDQDVALMLETARTIETEFEDAFAGQMPSERFVKVKQGIATMARERVISDLTKGLRTDARALDPAKVPDEVGAVLMLPLAPLTGMQGMTDTASAINRLNSSVVSLGLMVEDLPMQARWQADYVLMEMQTGKTAKDLRATLEETRQYAEKMSKAADQGLAEVEKTRGMITSERETVLKQLGQERLAATRDANEAINRSLKRVDEIRLAALKDIDMQRVKTLEALDWSVAKAMGQVTQEREATIRAVDVAIDRVFWRGVILVVIVFVGALVVVWYAKRGSGRETRRAEGNN